SLERFAQWAPEQLTQRDQGVLEATGNAWTRYDPLAPLVGEVKSAPPLLVQLLSAARVKPDTRDPLHLARLLAAGPIPQVWVPPAGGCGRGACGWHTGSAWGAPVPRPPIGCTVCCRPARSRLRLGAWATPASRRGGSTSSCPQWNADASSRI